jgi:putative ABC transport system permease protein
MTILQIALGNLRQRKLKSLFVMLGLAIGIATIVSIYSVLETMKIEMTRQMTDYGANILVTADTGELTFSYGGITIPGVLYDVEQLTTEHVAAIDSIEARPMIRAVVPKLLGMAESAGEDVVIAGSDLKSEFSIKPWLRIVDFLARVQGTGKGSDTGSSMGGEKLDLEREDYSRIELSEKEVILGAGVAFTLGLVPTNRFLLDGKEFTVKAILEKNGAAEDDQVLMNLGSAQQLLGLSEEVTTIELAADYTAGSEEELLGQIRTMLPNARVTSLRKAMLDRDEVVTRLSHFGFSVSIFILLAGMLAAGLGMSAAVRERTREIGIFRAIGFRKSHIRKIILLEGTILSIVGGLLGFALGTGLAGIAAPIVAGATLAVAWRMDILAVSMLLALVIGAIASVYPAQQAAKLDPAEALRFI